jgi:hypothetical protein
MLSLRTASPTNVPGQTASSTCCLLTSSPGCSSSTFKTPKAFGRKDIARVPCHKHSLAMSNRNCPKVMFFTNIGNRWADDTPVWILAGARGTHNIIAPRLSHQPNAATRPCIADTETTETSPQDDRYIMTRAQEAGYFQNRYEGIAAHKCICDPVSGVHGSSRRSASGTRGACGFRAHGDVRVH